MAQIETELRQFVIDNFLFGQGDVQLENDDSFMERGIVDSTGVLELVTFLEKQYQIKVEGKDLIPDNLDSISNLLRFLENKLQIA
ncbi:MAG: acyl carrier protein [Nitrospiria bacterium]